MRLLVEDVSCVRGGRRVFAGLGFALESGGMTALRGPNGAGKSTLLRAMAGLLAIERGDVRLGPFSLKRDRDAVQERIVYSGHLDAVKPSLGVLENLVFWAEYYGAAPAEARERAQAALDAVDLSHIADAPAGYCSAGQKRRLGLARLAVIDRPVWLLDEPTVSLDAASVAALGKLIESHRAEGGMVVAATHLDLPGAEAATFELSGFAPEPGEEGAVDPFLDGDWSES